MRGVAYRNVLDQKPKHGEPEGAYVLQLGSIELRPIGYATLLGLRERDDMVCEILDLCFVDRPVLWADPVTVHLGSYRARLGEIETLLRGVDFRLKESEQLCDRVIARVVELWHGLTHEAVARLETGDDSEATLSTRSVLADYRCAAYACVEALVQLLPEDRECAVDTRAKLEIGRDDLVRTLGIEREHIEHAAWRAEEQVPEEPGFVTWGIP
ncbi:MAG: hypothetical protein ACE5GX_04310 [Thermoanaerobaculia bacterium]